MNKHFFFSIIALTIIISKNTKAQGCSDAGFCTLSSFKHESTKNKLVSQKQRLTLITPVGVGDENVFVFSPALQYDIDITKSFALQGKITGNYASGNLGSVSGLGDIFITGAYAFPHKTNWQFQVTGGVKIPLNQSNLKVDGKPLPMQYQSSLGTFDIIAGLTVNNSQWQFSTAVQLPLTKYNLNGFLPIYWPAQPEAAKYPPSLDFRRVADILLRAGHNFKLGQALTANVGLLGIYHLGEDKYSDANVSNNPIPIKGSSGLTLNFTTGIWWQTNSAIKLGLTAGTPFVVRDIRPDGLTRKFVIAPELSWSF